MQRASKGYSSYFSARFIKKLLLQAAVPVINDFTIIVLGDMYSIQTSGYVGYLCWFLPWLHMLHSFITPAAFPPVSSRGRDGHDVSAGNLGRVHTTHRLLRPDAIAANAQFVGRLPPCHGAMTSMTGGRSKGPSPAVLSWCGWHVLDLYS